jgi:hypothetical protein
MAYNISVAVGDKLTIFRAFSADGADVSDDDESLPQALKIRTEAAIRPTARLRSERVFFIVDLPPSTCLEKEEWVTESGVSRLPPRTALPSRTGFSHKKIRRPDLSQSGFPVENHRCGTVPGSHRTSLMLLQHLY